MVENKNKIVFVKNKFVLVHFVPNNSCIQKRNYLLFIPIMAYFHTKMCFTLLGNFENLY